MNFKDFEKKYITDFEYIREAYALKEDIVFLSTLVDRNKNSMFDFTIVPTKHCNIRGSFLEGLWSCFYGTDDETLRKFIMIYKISVAIIENLVYQELDVSELVMWSDLIKWDYGYDILDNIGSLVGGSWQCEAIDEAVNTIRNEG